MKLKYNECLVAIERFITQLNLDSFCKANCPSYQNCIKNKGTSVLINNKYYRLRDRLIKKLYICSDIKYTMIGVDGVFHCTPFIGPLRISFQVFSDMYFQTISELNIPKFYIKGLRGYKLNAEAYLFENRRHLRYIGNKQFEKIRRILFSENSIKTFREYKGLRIEGESR
jgi:hypothetical protein